MGAWLNAKLRILGLRNLQPKDKCTFEESQRVLGATCSISCKFFDHLSRAKALDVKQHYYVWLRQDSESSGVKSGKHVVKGKSTKHKYKSWP
jgi:hypothetical protein